MSYIRFDEFGPNAAFLEELYQDYLRDPSLVSSSWAEFFQSQSLADSHTGNIIHEQDRLHPYPVGAEQNGKHTETNGGPHQRTSSHGSYTRSAPDAEVQERIYRMVSAFRHRGHLAAMINPLSRGVMSLPRTEDTHISFYQFTEEQLEQDFACAGFGDHEYLKLSELIDELQKVYCSTIGFEFTHIPSQKERSWLQERIERRFDLGYRLEPEERLERLRNIVHAESFEEELHKKYIGSKRFSLQGAETMIPMLLSMLETASLLDIRSAVFGMAHRGRLNVLANIFSKSLEQVFTEFEDTSLAASVGAGDVKYHLGYESLYKAKNGQDLRLSLAPNPSHLEFVNPVVEGMIRALQDRQYNSDRKAVLPVLIHGDAAFAGQGVVFETLNFSRVKGYNTGGTVHLIINNQIGFTTDPVESRSSTYCTDMAKAIQAPIFHVNCEDVEGACWVMRNALEFRTEFNRDVVIDLYCYRKYGHNEGDDPSFTQPVIYSEIRNKNRISDVYASELVAEGTARDGLLEEIRDDYHSMFEGAQERKASSVPIGAACSVHGRLRVSSPETGVSAELLEKVARTLIEHPEHFVPHEKLQKILEKRVQTLFDDTGIEWGFAEALAYGSLMLDGVNIRLSGQDCGRGTFSQRHLELTHSETGKRYFPLSKLTGEGVGTFEVYNSTLSEAAVLGFEFGFSAIAKQDLVLWEAQFGDFANGAQVIIDQFIAASEAKWNQRSGVVMLLPHGYEGQGPEHSSARLERFLQLCAEGNIVVAYPSTAEQYFHLLRRQALEKIKRPLVVMTPKSLLRLPSACSSRSEFEQGRFDTIISEQEFADADIRYVFFLSGKVYHDVKKALSETEFQNYELIRVEQLYPFPVDEVKKRVQSLGDVECFWVQEEPQNMGAWSYLIPYFYEQLQLSVQYIGRPSSASTAAGSGKRHASEQESILETIAAICSGA